MSIVRRVWLSGFRYKPARKAADFDDVYENSQFLA
jgi:hypothetical protein